MIRIEAAYLNYNLNIWEPIIENFELNFDKNFNTVTENEMINIKFRNT